MPPYPPYLVQSRSTLSPFGRCSSNTLDWARSSECKYQVFRSWWCLNWKLRRDTQTSYLFLYRATSLTSGLERDVMSMADGSFHWYPVTSYHNMWKPPYSTVVNEGNHPMDPLHNMRTLALHSKTDNTPPQIAVSCQIKQKAWIAFFFIFRGTHLWRYSSAEKSQDFCMKKAHVEAGGTGCLSSGYKIPEGMCRCDRVSQEACSWRRADFHSVLVKVCSAPPLRSGGLRRFGVIASHIFIFAPLSPRGSPYHLSCPTRLASSQLFQLRNLHKTTPQEPPRYGPDIESNRRNCSRPEVSERSTYNNKTRDKKKKKRRKVFFNHASIRYCPQGYEYQHTPAKMIFGSWTTRIQKYSKFKKKNGVGRRHYVILCGCNLFKIWN